jgi:hypothetical protein
MTAIVSPSANFVKPPSEREAMSSRLIGTGLLADRITTGTQQGCDAVERKGPQRATLTEARNREFSRLVGEAIKLYGIDALAEEMSHGADRHVDKGQVSRWASGNESTPGRALLPLLKDEASAMALLTAMARYAGLAPPTRVRKVTREEVERDLAGRVRECTALWDAFKRQTADALGTTEEDVEAAYAGGGGK